MTSKKVQPIGEFNVTGRGFGKVTFTDRYGIKGSVQQSSSASEDCLWIGVDNAKATAQVMASAAHMVDVKTHETTGWVPYPIPEQVLISDRLHMNRQQVRSLVKRLNIWLKTGELASEEEAAA